jgi:hypothetical protein
MSSSADDDRILPDIIFEPFVEHLGIPIRELTRAHLRSSMSEDGRTVARRLGLRCEDDTT